MSFPPLSPAPAITSVHYCHLPAACRGHKTKPFANRPILHTLAPDLRPDDLATVSPKRWPDRICNRVRRILFGTQIPSMRTCIDNRDGRFGQQPKANHLGFRKTLFWNGNTVAPTQYRRRTQVAAGACQSPFKTWANGPSHCPAAGRGSEPGPCSGRCCHPNPVGAPARCHRSAQRLPPPSNHALRPESLEPPRATMLAKRAVARARVLPHARLPDWAIPYGIYTGRSRQSKPQSVGIAAITSSDDGSGADQAD